MIELLLIGIGTGNPDHITRQAEKAIASADLIMIPTKGDNKADLADWRHDICAQIAGVDLSRSVEFELPVRDPAFPYVDRVPRDMLPKPLRWKFMGVSFVLHQSWCRHRVFVSVVTRHRRL